jgi:hypothetical protein
MALDISKRRKFEYSAIVNPEDEWTPHIYKKIRPTIDNRSSSSKIIQVMMARRDNNSSFLFGYTVDRSILLFFQYYFINMLIVLLNKKIGIGANQNLLVTVSCLGLFSLVENSFGRYVLLYILLFLFCSIQILHSIVSKNK